MSRATVVAVQVQLVHQRESGSGALRFADGDGAVESHDRRGGDREQPVVESDDLRPVGLLERSARPPCAALMAGLQLIPSGLVAAKAPAESRLAFLDRRTVPTRSILVAQKHRVEPSGRIREGRRASVNSTRDNRPATSRSSGMRDRPDPVPDGSPPRKEPDRLRSPSPALSDEDTTTASTGGRRSGSSWLYPPVPGTGSARP